VTTPPNRSAAEQLPAVIAKYLETRDARDFAGAAECLADDASVTDEGNVYATSAEIQSWMSRAASEYTYTIETTSVTALDGDHYDVVRHLEGNFPGATVDLHFRFTVRGDKIAQLVIEE
jgi:hypothetical protein